MQKTDENAVSGYFSYMQESWCEEECRTVFGARAMEVWKQWCGSISPIVSGGAERFYAVLADDRRRLLVERAVQLHDGRTAAGDSGECAEPEIIVCEECGSRDIQQQAWIDPNSAVYISVMTSDRSANWCEQCEEHVWFCTRYEFRQTMQAWWNSLSFTQRERITGLQREDFSPDDDGDRDFLAACNDRWCLLDYEQQRKVWKQNP